MVSLDPFLSISVRRLVISLRPYAAKALNSTVIVIAIRGDCKAPITLSRLKCTFTSILNSYINF